MAWKASDLFDPLVVSDEEKLHSLFKWMRENAPLAIAEDPTGKFPSLRTIVRYNDLIEIEKQPEIFTNEPQSVMNPKADEERSMKEFGKLHILDTLISMDPPQHTAYRKLTQAWFNPGQIQKLSGRIREIAKEHVDLMAKTGSIDFAQQVTTYYPLHIIMLILGIPREDEQFMMKLTQDLMSPEDPDTLGEREKIDVLERRAVFAEYFMNLTARLQAHPDDSLGSVIANATIDGQEIPLDLRIGYFILIIIAGHDTTKFASSGGMLALLQHPQQMKKLRDKPALMPLAIEEMIRWAAPVRHFLRTAQQDYVLSGAQIKKGERLMLLYASASRDSSRIPDADQFLVDRDPNRHLSFGHGIHVCLGQHLARLEMRMLFEEVLARFGTIELAGTPEGLQTIFVSGIKKLPIRYR